MTRIHHPETDATVDVPDAVVRHWTERAGWALVEAAPKPGKTLVLARTKAQATQHVKDAGLDPARVVYVDGPDALRGVTADDVDDLVELDDYAEHRRAPAIAGALAAAGIRTTPTTTGGDEDDPSTDSSTTTSTEE